VKHFALLTAAVICAGRPVAARATSRAYVPTFADGTVSVIDTSSDAAVMSVPLAGSVGGGWSHVALHPHAARAYVTASGRPSLWVLDTATNTVVDTVPLGDSGLHHPVAVHPDGHRVYVGRQSDIAVIDAVTNAVQHVISDVGPNMLALAPDGSRLYVLHDRYNGGLTIIDTATYATIATVAESYADAVAHPDGTREYLADADSFVVSVLGTTTNAIVGTIPYVDPIRNDSGYRPHLAIHPDGTRLYVTSDTSTRVYVLDTGSAALRSSIDTGASLFAVGVHPDGTRAYLVSLPLPSKLLVFDTVANAVTKSIGVGRYPEVFGSFVGGCPGGDGDCDGDGIPDATDNCFLPNPDQADADGDGVGDVCDNCLNTPNVDQTDSNRNGVGDACEDTDGDGIVDLTDNCPTVPNPAQTDTDGDGHGDACDVCPGHDDRVDTDGDGLADGCDNCPTVYNPGQADANANGIGDACDDRDGDGVVDAVDNCPDVPNSAQEDADQDRVGDACDPCTDRDRDGFGDPGFPLNTCPVDNCPAIANPDQVDADHDGRGDACQVCDALVDVRDFSAVAETVLKTGVAVAGGYQLGVEMDGKVCATKMTFLGSYGSDDLVAVKGVGNAIAFNGYDNANNVYTGGGTVKGPREGFVSGTVDTSGTHPLVASCRQAQAAALSASAELAALPPSQSLGDITVNAGDTVYISGDGAIDIGSLTVNGKWGTGFCSSSAELYISGGAVVLNVRGRLSIGSCARIDVTGDAAAVINVPGRGRTIHVGGAAYVVAPILAPARNLVMSGTKTDADGPSTLVSVWVKGLRATGASLFDDRNFGIASCLP